MFDLSKFNEYREDNRREVKKARNGLPDSLWSTYSAFANCYGGVIILGVEENRDGSWHTTGLQEEGKLIKDFWNNINNPQKMSHNLLTEQYMHTVIGIWHIEVSMFGNNWGMQIIWRELVRHGCFAQMGSFTQQLQVY